MIASTLTQVKKRTEMYQDNEDYEDNRDLYEYKYTLKKLFLITLFLVYIIKTYNINFHELYLSFCKFIKNM